MNTQVNRIAAGHFCGCCWRCISDRQELARQLIEDGKV